jgi:hypothetical protein
MDSRQSSRSSQDALLIIMMGILCGTAAAQDRVIDFRYSPSSWYSAICLPQDRQKTLISDHGALCYDFGPGPYVHPLTTVGAGFRGVQLHMAKQYLPDPIVPRVITELASSDGSVILESFSLITAGAEAPEPGAVRRRGGITGAEGWAPVPPGTDPAFRNVAWGTNRPIDYLLPVRAGAKKKVALGLCESYKPKTGMRVLDLRVEGSARQIVDPYAAAGHTPQIYLFNAEDTDNDGLLHVSVHAAETSPDPNVFLNAIWVFPETCRVEPQAVMRGSMPHAAEYCVDCGSDLERSSASPRIDVIRATFSGTGIPVVTVSTRRVLSFDVVTGTAFTDGRPLLISRPSLKTAHREGDSWQFELPPGTTTADILVFSGDNTMTFPTSVPDLGAERTKAEQFWKSEFQHLRHRIVVPDSALQTLLDISLRNLYQISEKIDGQFQFQPGPSVYRGLWVHDAVRMMVAALTVGDSLHVRKALDALFRFQHPDGQLEVMSPHVMFRETPLLIFAICRYGRVTGDCDWLLENWNRIQRGITWLEHARRQTLQTPDAPNAGLFPPGFADGGLAGVNAEYVSVYWSLIAIHEAVRTAAWLGRTAEAGAWQQEFNDLKSAFRKAAARDLRKDQFGNLFLPMKVGDTSAVVVPQRAQWAVCEAIALGRFFPRNDSLVTGTLAMLDGESVEGLAPNTGWLQDGVWPWFGPFHGIAHLEEGNTERAADILYAVANHACPLGTWVEEQLPRSLGTRTSGDVSNATGGALMIEFASRFIVEERADTLVLLPHIPDAWIIPGGVIALRDVPTVHGRVSVQCRFARDGQSAEVDVTAPSRDRNAVTLVELRQLKRKGYRAKEGTSLPDTFLCPPGETRRIVCIMASP